MKRIDLHTHAKLSKTFPFAIKTVHQFIAQARRLNLDGLALVEHLHAVQYWEIHDALGREFRYNEAAGAYEGPDGFRLLSGAELSIAEGCDLIVLAAVGQLRELDRSLAKPATQGYRAPFDEAVAAAHAVGAFVIGAHLVRPGKELAKVGIHKLCALDALELNGKDFSSDDRVRAVAEPLEVPLWGAATLTFGHRSASRRRCCPLDGITQTAVASAIRTGGAAVESQHYGPIAVQFSESYKRLAKARAAHAAAADAYRERAFASAPVSDTSGRVR